MLRNLPLRRSVTLQSLLLSSVLYTLQLAGLVSAKQLLAAAEQLSMSNLAMAPCTSPKMASCAMGPAPCSRSAKTSCAAAQRMGYRPLYV